MNRYRRLCERRDVFSSVIRTQALDAELAAYRRALTRGEIAQAEAHRRNAQQMVESVEKDWARISFQIAEANQMVRALRELGGVAPSVLRPIAAAVRVPRRAEAAQIEGQLDQANDLLWRLLVPRMEHEVSKCRSALHKVRAPATRLTQVRFELARMEENVRSRKVGDALDSRRFVRSELALLLPRTARRAAPASFSIDEAHPS